MVYDKANELAKLLKESDEFREYKTTKEKAFENDTTASLIKEYHKLQLAAQAAMVSVKDDETMQRLQKIGELLQLNQDASAFLFAEYRLNRVVSDIYKIIAEAIDVISARWRSKLNTWKNGKTGRPPEEKDSGTERS